MTQVDLAEKLGLTQRVIAYYEGLETFEPGSKIAAFAEVLRVSADILLGLKPPEDDEPRNPKLWRRFKAIEQFPEEDRRAVFKFVDLMAAKHSGNGGTEESEE